MNAALTGAAAVRVRDVHGAGLTAILASLPDDFTSTPSGETDASLGHVVVVDGRRPDWPSLVQGALATARAVMLREPGQPAVTGIPAADHVVRDLAHLASSAGVPVVVDRRWSGAPGVRAFAQEFAGAVATATSVTVLLVDDELTRSTDDAVLDALGLARAAGVASTRLDRVQRRAGSWSAWGRTSGGPVLHLQGVHSSADAGAVLTASSATAEASVRVPDARTAAPALARCADAAGERTLPTEFEPAARAAWRRLHEHLVEGEEVGAGAELAALADDLALLGGAV